MHWEFNGLIKELIQILFLILKKGNKLKLLIFYVNSFSFETNHKGLESAVESNIKEEINNAVLGFIHVEEKMRAIALMLKQN